MADIQTGVPVKHGKMNKWLKGLLIAGAVLTALLITLGIIDRISQRAEQRDSANTLGTREFGNKAFYLSAEQYLRETAGIKTERWTKVARFLPGDAAVLCMYPGGDIYSDSEIAELRGLVERGGLLIITDYYSGLAESITENEYVLTEPGDGPKTLDNGWTAESVSYRSLSLLKYTKNGGELWIYDTQGESQLVENLGVVPELSNLGMKMDKAAARDLLLFLGEKCTEKHYDRLLFDECYNGLGKDPTADILGYGLVLGAVELFAAAVFFFISAGQRFGAPERVLETEKRNETEHITALAKMYRRTGSESIGFRIQMEALLEDAAAFLGMRAPYNYEEIADAADNAPALKGSGISELIRVYRNIDDIRLTAGKLDKYIGQMDRIRRERLL
jgi:hypothetical protein